MKNEDTKVFKESTVSQRFSKLCGKWGISHKITNASKYTLPEEPFDKKSIMEMVQSGITKTLIDTGTWYMVRDNFGVVEFVDIAGLKTNLILGEYSLATGYDYKTSIDSDTANQIKLYRDNKESGKRDVYIVKDSSTIQRWGMLQYMESVNEEMTSAQIEQKADNLLKLKNRVSRKLSLTCIGDWRVMPGVGVWVETQLDDMKLSRYMLVHSVTHTATNKQHTMQVTLEVAE